MAPGSVTIAGGNITASGATVNGGNVFISSGSSVRTVVEQLTVVESIFNWWFYSLANDFHWRF